MFISKSVMLILGGFLLLACSSTKNPPNKEPSDYRPVVLPQALPPNATAPNDPGAEPGSPTSPAVQQLPKASP